MQKVRRHQHNLKETIYKMGKKEERLAQKLEELELRLKGLQENSEYLTTYIQRGLPLKLEVLEKKCEYLMKNIHRPYPETERNGSASYTWSQRLRDTLENLSCTLEDMLDDVAYYASRFAYYFLLLPIYYGVRLAYYILLRPLLTLIRILVPLLFVGAGFFFLFSGKIATSIQCFIVGALIIGCYKVLVSALRERSF